MQYKMNFLRLRWSARWLDSIPCLLVGGSVGRAGQSVRLVRRSIIPCAILLVLHGNQSTIKSTISNSNPTGHKCECVKVMVSCVKQQNLSDKYSIQMSTTDSAISSNRLPKLKPSANAFDNFNTNQGVFKCLNAVSDLFLRKSCSEK